jgi:hypothetical protein
MAEHIKCLIGSGPAGTRRLSTRVRANMSPIMYMGFVAASSPSPTMENFPGYADGVMVR